MEIVEITEEDAEEFSGFIDETEAAELEREFFKGIGVLDTHGNVRGAMIYELKNMESEEASKSRIMTFAGDEEAKDALMSEYATAIKDYRVSESFYESDDREMASSLQDYGFSYEQSESLNVTLDMDDIRSIGSTLNVQSFPSHIVSLSEVSVPLYRKFVKRCISDGSVGLLDDLSYLPIWWFDRELSSCSVNDHKMDGAFLIRKTQSGSYHALLFTAFGLDYKKNLALLMAYSVEKAINTCSDDAKVVVRRHSPSVERISERFFADKKGESVYVGSRGEI